MPRLAPSQYLEHQGIQIAAGNVLHTLSVHKFGAVPSMSINNTGTIWDVDDTLYPWSTFSSAAVINVERNDVADEGKTVTIQGLDGNYNLVEDTVTISGTDTLTTQTFIRVFRAFTTSGTNTANIDLEYGAAGGTTVARINAGKGQTLMGIYTVPAGYTAFIMQGTATVQAGADATGDMFVRYFGQDAFRVGHSFEVSGAGGQYFYPFSTPIKIPAKSDIDVRASVRSNNARVTAAFDLILVRD